ncbi:hypothetical protein FOPG_18615 [Fusarium oxysporum f. sp. conglutinans race 2 54008]|uniref:Uncharacterized protein n=1 Tax=Fusarium oxysporum f. sp. conglutinans race 2 54008 TaxID=1089457 RepID=X0HVF0_FUSOX|nr:hypothetical protein FOPG_18615 [Fusarium oxysporum f. sp. conglutinans race 2 54008]KAI8416364.1 hypothetical protein FOFC_02673 [Fusarium oxysporum]
MAVENGGAATEGMRPGAAHEAWLIPARDTRALFAVEAETVEADVVMCIRNNLSSWGTLVGSCTPIGKAWPSTCISGGAWSTTG